MYGIDGRHQLSEETLPHLRGYRDSAPVRVGNAAYSQLQLDIYGELMDSVYLFDKWGTPISYDLWQNLVRLVNWVTINWHRADEGIWEVRGRTTAVSLFQIDVLGCTGSRDSPRCEASFPCAPGEMGGGP
jgi:GH15 family glucan-1,4-alpha-glucosidase